MEHTDNLDLTNNAWNHFYDVVDDPKFDSDPRNNPQAIMNNLMNEMLSPVFGDYLKRYIHQAQGLDGDYTQRDISYYVNSVIENFSFRNTPPSFEPSSTTLKNAAKNWLTRKTVSRKTVFLLGFGFGMTTSDVNMFLQKGLCEQLINPKDPFEVICWYCFENGFGYEAFEELNEEYLALSPAPENIGLFSSEYTSNIRDAMYSISDEEQLLSYLSGLKANKNVSKFSRTSKEAFSNLYNKVKETIAEQDKIPLKNVSTVDVELLIYSGVPKNKDGNLEKEDLSALSGIFQGKRLSRHRIGQIDSDKTEVTRFDLITLNFLVFAQQEDIKPQKRYSSFLKDTNKLLASCDMHEYIIQNPYENFILACTLTEDPLGTYWDVWSESFVWENEKED